MRPLQLLSLLWPALVHFACGSSPTIDGLDSANLIQKRVSKGEDDPAAPDTGDDSDDANAAPKTPSELHSIAKELNARQPEQPSDFDHFFIEEAGPDAVTDPFEIKEEMLESCPEMSDELLEKMKVLPFMSKEELLAARDWAFENQTADFAFTKAKDTTYMEKPPWWVKPLEKKNPFANWTNPFANWTSGEKATWPKMPWSNQKPWWSGTWPKMPWSNQKPAKPIKPTHQGNLKTKSLGQMMSGNSSNTSNTTTGKPYPAWYPLGNGPEFIPPTLAPYIPSYEIVLLIQIYMPWANDLVLPMNCNRLAPIRDIVLTACYKMKVSRKDCLDNSIYTTGYFEIGAENRDAELLDISLRPIDVALGEVNRTVITWLRV